MPLEFKVGDSEKPTYNNFIDQHAKTSGPITEEEHVAFLTFWLSRYVLCSRSMQVAKQRWMLNLLCSRSMDVEPLVPQIHKGVRIALGPLLLSHMHSCLTDVSTQMTEFDPNNPKKKRILAYGPFWLLQ